MKFLVLAVASIAVVCTAHAEQNTDDPVKIQAILKSIPVTDKGLGYKNLAERLPNVGMKATLAKTSKIGKGEEEPPYFKVGDQVIDIYLTEPNQVVTSICPISGGRATYVLRGKKFIAQTRTAHWLMTNRCDFKG